MEGGETCGEEATPHDDDGSKSVPRPESVGKSTVNKISEVAQLREELNRYKSENLRLDGKLRGYSTLNQLFQESKDQCRNLHKENLELKQEIKKKDSTRKISVATYNGTEEAATLQVRGKSDRVKALSSNEQAAEPGHAAEVEELIVLDSLSAADRQLGHLSEDVTTDSDVADADDLDKLSGTRLVGGASGLASTQFVSTVNSAHLYGLGSLHHPSSAECSYSNPPDSTQNVSGPVAQSSLDEMRGGNPLSIHVDADFGKLAAKTAQLKHSERQWKAFAGTLQAEYQKLKKEVEEKGNTISQVKTENLMLIQKIKKVEHERDLLSPGDSVKLEGSAAGAGWVHVTKEQASSPGPTEDSNIVISLQKKLQALELNNSKLLEANKRWEVYRYQEEAIQQEKTAAQQEKIVELQRKVESSERALAEYRSQDEKRQREIDKLLLTSKRRGDQLESEKEELLDKLEQCNNQIEALERRLQQQQHQTQNQLSAHGVTPTAPVSPSVLNLRNSEYQPSRLQLDEIVNEKEALKQQLMIFQEDFNKERADRAQAQSEKDSLRRNVADLTRQLKRAQAQQKSADDGLRDSLAQNEQFRQQVTSLKRQLKASEESVRRLLEENEQLRVQVQRLKHQFQQNRHPNVVTPPPGGQPFYPPTPRTPRTPQSPRWPDQHAVYQTAQPSETGPELLPGSWQCPSCTYVNYARRTVCEMCGAVNHQNQWDYVPNLEEPTRPQAGYQWDGYGTDTHANPRNLVPRGLESTNLLTDSGPP